jgi:hypothetical protein
MLKGVTLAELASKIEAQQKTKVDFVADTAQTKMLVPVNRKPVLALPNDRGEFPILPLAHNQIAGRTGIPVKYYDRMHDEQPDLLARNVNTWFTANPEKRMVRVLAGNARAFLSNRYQRIDYAQVAEAALPVLYDLPNVQIVSCEITDRRLYIHFVVPTIQGEVKVGDVVQAGGIISDSEVGLGSVSIAGLTWRLRCLNGMKSADTFRRNHVGRAVEDDSQLDWADDTKRADDATVLLKVRDMVRAVVDETRFRERLSKLQGLNEGKITGDPAKAVEVLAQKVGANETEKGGILRALIEGGDLSRWGVVNAVTSIAHSAQSYDRAVEIEAAGGALVDLAPHEWRDVLEAA